jgi:RHS repeat-associated protein
MRQTTGTSSINYSKTPTGGMVGYETSARHYFMSDLQGSVLGMFGSSGAHKGGYSYSPYGQVRSIGTDTAMTTNPIRYVGGYKVDDNHLKLGARYYDTSNGRFTQLDPSGQNPTYS